MNWVFLLNWLSGEWKTVSRDEAEKNENFGFWGWLLIFYLFWLWGCIDAFLAIISPSESGTSSNFVGDPDTLRYVNMICVSVLVPFLVLAPLKHPLAPKAWIGGMWTTVIVLAVTIDMPGQVDAMFGIVAISVVMTSLFSWYALRSKRVNVTYLSRVPANEAEQQGKHFSVENAALRKERKYRIMGWTLLGIVVALLIGILLPMLT